jgi:hypothetical protein
MERRIPVSWTDSDRRLYIGIGKRKKNEHVSGYTTIAIGCQLFYGLTKHLRDKQPDPNTLSGEDCTNEGSNVQPSVGAARVDERA